jgi:hypothetical protein
MTSVVDPAVATGTPTGDLSDTLAEQLIDAMTAAMQASAMRLGVELGRHQALAAAAATAPLLVQAGRPESAATLLAGVADARSTVSRPGSALVADPHGPPVAEISGTTARGRTPRPDRLLAVVREKLEQHGDGRPHPEPAGEPVRAPAEFYRIGDLWRIAFAGACVHLPHRKGITDLVVLLARPGREIAALDLAGAAAADRLEAPGDLGERLDARARAAYTARIRQLQDDLDDADATGDAERSARVQHEMDFLTSELSAAYGLRGPRRTGDPAEKARTAVTMRLRATLAKIRQVHPTLGAHLQRSITTGRFCSYLPEEPISWHIAL